MAVQRVSGQKFEGVDFNTAPGGATGTDKGFVIGYTPLLDIPLLKVDPAELPAELLQLKYYHHLKDDPKGDNRLVSNEYEYALTMLVGGGPWRQRVWSEGTGDAVEVLLQVPGDFIAWGPRLKHSWYPVEASTMLTLRWRRMKRVNRVWAQSRPDTR